jgi:hypothetical protein
MNLFNFFLKTKSFFVKKPKTKLTWTVTDYELGRRWSKTEPHPFLKSKTLWDYCYDPYDSVYTLKNLNTFIQV